MKSLQKQLDYDQKRLMATRAIHQSKPCASEPRTPTQTWSGLGFSNSMPENVIREKLAAEEAANKVITFPSLSGKSVDFAWKRTCYTPFLQAF